MSTAPINGAGLYVDVENLRSDGQRLIKNLLQNWPSVAPTPSLLCLYVRADMVELWRLWATSQFQTMVVVVRGVQHFSASSSKNSADIAIATNAIADLLLGRVSHVVVLSDDSDFISLYIAIRDEMYRSQPKTGTVPFLWVVTDRGDSVSSTVKQYFPITHLHVMHSEDDLLQDPGKVSPSKSQTDRAAGVPPNDAYHWVEIAQAIIEHIPVGQFKSTDCQRIIKKNWPSHPMAEIESPAFGTEFKKNILPILEKRGVRIANPGKKPIRYEMTQSAKLPGS